MRMRHVYMDAVKSLMGGGQTVVLPPPAPPPPAPTLQDATALLNRQGSDELARKRGRQASVLTGPEGVGATQPVQVKTLIGS